MKISSNPSATGSDSAVVQWVKKLDMSLFRLAVCKGGTPLGLTSVCAHMCTHTPAKVGSCMYPLPGPPKSLSITYQLCQQISGG